MQVQKTRTSKYLFEVLLQPEEVQALIHLEPPLLKNLLMKCSKTFQKHIFEPLPANLFLKNYKMIMELHSSEIANNTSVELCLHFALLFSQHHLLHNRHNQAKAILKQTEDYAQIEGVDAMLLSLCLSNLAQIYSLQGKVYRSLALTLKTISILQQHLEELNAQKKKAQLRQDMVVFVNVLAIALSVLRKILKINPKEHFQSLFKTINKTGYSFSHKYLGSDSFFAKKFFFTEQSVLLPFYESQEEQEQQTLESQFQTKIAKELQNIYKALSELNLEPEVFYIRQNIVENKSKSQSSIIKPDEPEEVQIFNQFSVCYEEKFDFMGFDAEVSIFKDQTNLMATNMGGSDYIGHLQFKFRIGKKVIQEKIPEEKLVKILNCINVNDILPHQYEMKALNSDQFFRKCLIHFVQVSPEQKVVMRPRSLPIITPFQKKFCGQKVLIFVNHIYFTKFRVAICPKDTPDSIYLDLDFKDKQIYQQFKLLEIQNYGISKLLKKYEFDFNNYQNHLSFGKLKKVFFHQPDNFKTIIFNILDHFQSFLNDEDIDIMEELTGVSFEEHLKYYKYVQEKDGKGSFFELRYRANANHIELFAKNNYQTYSPEGLAPAKGNTVISPQKFLKDFGLALRPARKWLPVFFSLITQKYTLKTWTEPIQEMDQDRYQQNAVTEQPLTNKIFKRKFIEFQNHLLPLTIELLSVGNQKPIGIKVTAYQPIKCVHVGLFIYINFDYWHKIETEESIRKSGGVDAIEIKKNKLLPFEEQSFLTQWLRDEGFQKIYSRLVINNRSLQIKGITGKFYRLEDLL